MGEPAALFPQWGDRTFSNGGCELEATDPSDSEFRGVALGKRVRSIRPRDATSACPVSCALSSMTMKMSYAPFAKPCSSILCELVSFPPGHGVLLCVRGRRNMRRRAGGSRVRENDESTTGQPFGVAASSGGSPGAAGRAGR